MGEVIGWDGWCAEEVVGWSEWLERKGLLSLRMRAG